MERRKLAGAFEKIKELAEMDYAITDTDNYGDCMSCVNYELASKFGEDSTGIFVKVWLKGMNKTKGWKDLDRVYIVHDITKEQAEIMVRVLEECGFTLESTTYDPDRCFVVSQ